MTDAFPEPMRAWLERSPKARRAVKRLSDDLDALVARLESVIPRELRDTIAARIDPPATPPATPPAASGDAPPTLPEGQGWISEPNR